MSKVFVYTHLNVKTVLLQAIQFSVGIVPISKTVLLKQFSLTYKKSSILNNSV